MIFLRGYRVLSIFSEQLVRGWKVTVKWECDLNDDKFNSSETYHTVVYGRFRMLVTLRALFSARREARARLR